MRNNDVMKKIRYNGQTYMGFSEEELLTPLMVCKSAAGYYIGRLYYDQELKAGIPWSRNSVEYYSRLVDANKALECKTYTERVDF